MEIKPNIHRASAEAKPIFSIFGKKLAEKTATDSLQRRFPGMQTIASGIRNLTATISSTGNRLASIATTIKWSLYNCVASLRKKDEMSYSYASISGEVVDGSKNNEIVNIPATGSFKAGTDLQNRLAHSLFNTMLAHSQETKKNDATCAEESRSVAEIAADIYRCTSFKLIDEGNDDGPNIGFQLGSTEAKGTARSVSIINNDGLPETRSVTHQQDMTINAAGQINNFIGGSASMTTAIMGITNQALGNTICMELRAHRHGAENSNLMVESAIGFPTPKGYPLPTMDYTLKRVGPVDSADHFILSLDFHATTDKFLLKEDDKEGVNTVILPDAGMEFHDLLAIKITPNKYFNPAKPESRQNFPCTLQVINFTNTYTTALSRSKNETSVISSGKGTLSHVI